MKPDTSTETSQPYKWTPTLEAKTGIGIRPTSCLGSRPVATDPTSTDAATLAAIAADEEAMYN